MHLAIFKIIYHIYHKITVMKNVIISVLEYKDIIYFVAGLNSKKFSNLNSLEIDNSLKHSRDIHWYLLKIRYFYVVKTHESILLTVIFENTFRFIQAVTLMEMWRNFLLWGDYNIITSLLWTVEECILSWKCQYITKYG